MKIISTDKNPVWKTNIICKQCNALLEIEESDILFYNDAVGYAGETWEPTLFVVCAVCRSKCPVTYAVPSGIMNSIFDAHRNR